MNVTHHKCWKETFGTFETFSSKQYTIINILYNFTKLNSGQVLKISRESQPLTHFSFVYIINLLNGMCMKLTMFYEVYYYNYTMTGKKLR